MTIDHCIAVGALVLASVMLVGACRRVRLWRLGKKTPVDIIGGLIAAPGRYFVDLHEVVSRDRSAAWLHIPTAGGFVLITVLFCTLMFTGFDAILLLWMIIVALVVMGMGVVLAVLRRWPAPPERLAGGSWNRLMLSLALFVIGAAVVTCQAILLLNGEPGLAPPWLFTGVLFLLGGIAELYLGMTWSGPMKHAFAGICHLAFHPRPARFSPGQPSTGLQVEDLNTDRFGSRYVTDFKWNQLLGFDACVHCGRCEVACPAFAAGQPLSPRKLIVDLVTSLERSRPGSAAVDVIDAVGADSLWSCTTCRACVYECPMTIEHVDAIVDMRRYLSMETGTVPGKGLDVIEELRYAGNPSGLPQSARSFWAADLDLPTAVPGNRVEFLIWSGDGAFNHGHHAALKATARLLRKAGYSAALFGNDELDCGDLARRLGDDATFQFLAKRNIEKLKALSFGRVVTLDPHVLHCIRNEYPALGGRFEIEHHSVVLRDLLAMEAIRPKRTLSGRVTYHDPCYLGRYNGEFDAPREILARICTDFVEMDRSRERSRCCGGGGGAPLTDIPGERRIPDIRIADAKDIAADRIAVGCPNCAVMLGGVVEPRPGVSDVAVLLLEAVVEN